MQDLINKTTKRYQNDKTRLVDILLDIQAERGFLSRDDFGELANILKLSKAEVCETASFYHFFTFQDAQYKIYLNSSITSEMAGRKKVADALEEICSTSFGTMSEDGMFYLENTSCIGMNDQEPAALINGVPFTQLTPFRIKELIADLKRGKTLEESAYEALGDSKNSNPLVHSMVNNHIRKRGAVLSMDYEPFDVIKTKLCTRSPEEIITIVEGSNIRGRGGAGFPTGLKWKFGRLTKAEHRVLICNADEGEPGTFKDRVLLTEFPEMIFEGMVIGAFATGADLGVLYLRYEYKYLLDYLNSVLDNMRKNGYLGKQINGCKHFNFDIRIQLGAGAYVCGEESALIESMEGKRGEPRDKPPFPVEKGYLGYPTIVNNVETLVSIVKIIKNGAAWFDSMGTSDSSGTKILSISGDCLFPGIYEVEWGSTVNDVLEMSGAYDVQAIQVGGPSGMLLGAKGFNRTLSYSDLATGGSMIVFNQSRDILRDVVLNFMDFFIEESCGSCVSCRATVQQMQKKLVKILDGYGVASDLDDLNAWAKTTLVSRCGLGQTAANPIVSSLKNFPHLYKELLQNDKDFVSTFDMDAAIAESCKIVGREAVV